MSELTEKHSYMGTSVTLALAGVPDIPDKSIQVDEIIKKLNCN